MASHRKNEQSRIRFVFYAIAVVLVVLLFIELRNYNDIQGMVAQFFEECMKGNIKYVEENIPDISSNNKVFIKTLSQQDTIQWLEVGYVDLLPRKTKKVNISLGINDNKYKTSLWVTKSNSNWLIKDLPRLKTLEQAYIINQHAKETTTDFELLFDEKKQNLSYPAVVQGDLSDSICRLLMLDDQVVDIRPLNKKTGTKVLTVKDNQIEDICFGLLNLGPSVFVYQYKDGEIEAATLEDIIPGISNVDYYMIQDMVSAMVIDGDFPLDIIRIALNTTGFNGLKHQRVDINCPGKMVIENKIFNKSYTIPANTKVTFQRIDDGILWSYGDENFLSKAYRLHIRSFEGEPINVLSIMRGGDEFIPAYHGNLEVSMYEDGLAIINELPLEQYLYTVVPSEMPLSFGIEPLKAQAVAARTYAVSSIMKSGFRFAAAHVDDSVASQVYNNSPTYPIANQAVDNTQGEALFFDDQPINASFFSTSCGFTANNNEVWEDKITKEFPGTPVPYLQSRSQAPEIMMYLNDEQGVKDFLTSDIPEAYDTISPYFRWTIRLSQSQLQAILNSSLPSLERSQSKFVLGIDRKAQAAFLNQPFNIGVIDDIKIVKRGQGGNVMELEVYSAGSGFKIIKELNIRSLFKPTGDTNLDIYLHNGKVQKNYGLLPSAFIYLDTQRNERGELEYLTIYGGGNGHGCGMSQYGAYGLAQRGYNYPKILSHYYPGAEIKRIHD